MYTVVVHSLGTRHICGTNIAREPRKSESEMKRVGTDTVLARGSGHGDSSRPT